jgi:DNA-binding transcriptional MerR regulator
MVLNKSKSAFKTIAEVADELGVATHVLRFWETKFSQIKPMKATGGRRYYRPDDVEILKLIKGLLYGKRYTIEGAQHFIKEKGLKNLLGDNSDIQKDFFETESEASNSFELNADTVKKITDAVADLKNLRTKLANL